MGLSIGTLMYAFIKIGGYSLFAKYLNKLYLCHNKIWIVGLVRTFLGIGLGILHNVLFFSFFDISMGRSPIGGEGTYLYFIFLGLLRIIEWGLIIHWYYDHKLKTRSPLKPIILGISWSFVLDIPIIFGLLSVISSIC